MNRAYTVSPVHQDTEYGDQIVGFQVDHNHYGSHTAAEDYIEQEDGSFRHIHQDDPSVDPESNHFDFEDYLGGVIEAYPIHEALTTAAENPAVPQEFIEEWNNILELPDSEIDIDRFHQLMEFLLDQHQQYSPEQAESDVQQWFDALPQEELDQSFEELQQHSFTPDTAEQFVELAQSYQPSSVEHSMLKAGVDISFGKVSIEQAMQSLIKQYGEAETVAAYYKLNALQ